MSKYRRNSLTAILEPFALFFLLFFPGYGFLLGGRYTLLLVTLPSLGITAFFLKQTGKSLFPRLRIADIKSTGIGFFCLVCAGLLTSAAAQMTGLQTEIIEQPQTILQWFIILVTCFATGYLEEGFFRYYFFYRLTGAGAPQNFVTAVSMLLFMLCHVYEGIWGCVNALLAAAILSFLFLRERSIHGIALAHGLYNALVYALL